MSVWQTQEFLCPNWACFTQYSVDVASSLHATRSPAVTEQILARNFHRTACPGCGQRARLDRPLLYTHFAHHRWIYVAMPRDIGNWQQLEEECSTLYRRSMVDGAPPMIREVSHKFRVRLVFGYEELREKLILWDAQLDDAWIECIKLQVVARDLSLWPPGYRLVVGDIDDDGALVLHRTTDGELGAEIARVAFQDRDQLARAYRGRISELTDGGFVSVDRLFDRFGV